MLVPSIRAGSESWYQVFGSGQKVGTDSRPGGQSISTTCVTFKVFILFINNLSFLNDNFNLAYLTREKK